MNPLRLCLYGNTALGQRIVVWCSLVALLVVSDRVRGTGACADVSNWTHLYVANPLPGESWGAGGPALADYDGDGDLDIVSKIWNADSGRHTANYWRNDTRGNRERTPDS